MKKIIIVLLVLFTLAACTTETSSFSLDSNNDSAVIEAKNADTDSTATTSLEITDAEQLTVTAAIESGVMGIAFYDGEDNTEGEPAADILLYDGDSYTVTLPAGSYTMLAYVQEKATGKVEICVEEKQAEAQNPVMNFVGVYASGRCAITVEAKDEDEAQFSISWGSSAAEHTEWIMSGKLDTETMSVKYDDASKTNYVFNADGSVASEEVVYENGTGTFTFNADGTLTWVDDVEDAAADIVFDYVS